MYPDSGLKDNPKPARSEPNLSVEQKNNGANAVSSRALFLRRWRAWLLALFCLTLQLGVVGECQAADRLRLGVQKTGTFAWELAVIKAEGLDAKADLDLVVTELASTEAAKIALMGGSVDIILSDWLWVARERGLGSNLVFAPYSTALGAMMVAADSPVKTLDGLRGKTIGVAGGPLDKSWLLLRALAQRDGLDLKAERQSRLRRARASLSKGAESGARCKSHLLELRCRARGARLSPADRHGRGREAARRQGSACHRRLCLRRKPRQNPWRGACAVPRNRPQGQERSSRARTRIGRGSAKRFGVTDPKELALYRKSYIDGIPRRPVKEEAADAAALYHIVRDIGGPELVGAATELDPGTFYTGYTGGADQSQAEH